MASTLEDEVPKKNRRRTAKARRDQRNRAAYRTTQMLLKQFDCLQHRGCAPTALGAALAEVLKRQRTETIEQPRRQATCRPYMPTCRHAIAGTCTWGEHCRFSHRGLTAYDNDARDNAYAYNDNDYDNDAHDNAYHNAFVNDARDNAYDARDAYYDHSAHDNNARDNANDARDNAFHNAYNNDARDNAYDARDDNAYDDHNLSAHDVAHNHDAYDNDARDNNAYKPSAHDDAHDHNAYDDHSAHDNHTGDQDRGGDLVKVHGAGGDSMYNPLAHDIGDMSHMNSHGAGGDSLYNPTAHDDNMGHMNSHGAGGGSMYNPTETDGLEGRLSAGDKVKLVGLTQTPQLLGATGVLTGIQADRWKVRLDNGKGTKLIKAINISRLSGTDRGAHESQTLERDTHQ